ncbi:MAG: diphosphate--fructose-6-phosphate 1-phosphotransferase [Parachlamydiales bacterium]
MSVHSSCSPLQLQRQQYQPKLPSILEHLRQVGGHFKALDGNEADPSILSLFPQTKDQDEIVFSIQSGLPAHTPKRVGVLFSGGQASGGHNVITGLFDALVNLHHESRLFGFLGGPSGLISDQHVEITHDLVQKYRNQGGFDMIGSGRTKIETSAQYEAALYTAEHLKLDAIVIIGGDDSNTNAALLAEFIKSKGRNICVIGVPKTIDGDLKNEHIEISFGFDTASKTFADIIGNIARDALSAKKYYHFIRLMGRSASHIALECALQTHPNYVVIAEEVLEKAKTLQNITDEICDVISRRAAAGKNYGIILLPEGIIEFIPEFRLLINELNTVLAPDKPHALALDAATDKKALLSTLLSDASNQCFKSIPQAIQEQLLMDRDPHGNVQVSKIETEKLFITAVEKELEERKQKGLFQGKFSAQGHFLGYEGRSCYPSNFDSQYCNALGYVAALLIQMRATGYIATVSRLAEAVDEWQCGGIPLVKMMAMEERHGKQKPVIKKALVDLNNAPFKTLAKLRDSWVQEDKYCFPGPIQFAGLPALTEGRTFTLLLESSKNLQ